MARIAPPSIMNVLLEARAGGELALLLPQWPLLRLMTPRGTGRVIVLPGFLADDRWTWLLRRFLSEIGYTVEPWSLGVNRGPLMDYVRTIALRLERDGLAGLENASLVGWSRGGLIAREVARELPERVRSVVTLGSPIRSGLTGTRIGPWVATASGVSARRVSSWFDERSQRQIKVPVTSIYSRSDGVVAWKACRDDVTPGLRHREVESSHIGLVANAAVYRAVAEALGSVHQHATPKAGY
ncbi:MAG: alpha/beta fold hydrolase [Pseudomonadales bacterium]